MNLEPSIDALVERAMQAWNVPGLALAIVQDDQVLLAKGYGLRQAGLPGRVDAHTLFAIGSNTKAFTATALGLLVQEGQVAWDDPVTKYLPTFQLHDPHATQLITLRDLLCHRSGLGTWAGDVLLSSSYAVEDIVQRLRHIPPDFSFRAGFGYSNLMFITAGLVLTTVSGLRWDDFITQRLLAPLGMTGSVTHPRALGAHPNLAMPHEDIQGGMCCLPYHTTGQVGASGSILASAADLTRWMRLQLNQGSLDGAQIVDPAIIAETHTPHTLMPLKAVDRKLFPSRHFAAYGLGWMLSDTHGRFNVRHTGGLTGMLSSVILIPEERLGLAILTNKLPNAAYIALGHTLIEQFLGLPPQDWIQTYTDLERQNREQEQQRKQQVIAARASGTLPAFALEQYAGAYNSLILGRADLRVDDGGEQPRLRLRLQLQPEPQPSAGLAGSLAHWHYDTFQCTWDDPTLGESLVSFISDGQGRVAEFRLKIREDWIDPLEHVFKKFHA